MTDDPIKDIEERQSQYGLGLMAVRVFQGALSEGTWLEAYFATAAYFHSMMQKPDEDNS
jgi:hypothetical protein